MKPLGAQAIASAYLDACRAELDAPKPGNVHRFADGHRMALADFETSAAVSAPFIARAGLGVGERIEGAVAATFDAVGMNTNLGIVLLCAPLALAAETISHEDGTEPLAALHQGAVRVLAKLTQDDAEAAFRAIARAAPGGLGEHGEHDVRRPAAIGLAEAMRIASHRDRVARQYASGFEDVFAIGIPAFRAASDVCGAAMMPILHCFFAFASRFPDSHVERKFGEPTARRLQARLEAMSKQLKGQDNPEDALPLLLALDAELKAEGLNPGTSADLTVASIFASLLAEKLEECGRR